MRLTTKGRYAVTAMLDLCLNYEVKPVTLADISERQGISLSYLEQLFANLRRQGLVSSTRGPGGGYRLGRSADEVSVYQVISAVDNKNNYDEEKNSGRSGETCLSYEIWQSLSEQIRLYLDNISLADVMKNYQ
ncbi:MAG TPA: [Fe-S]-binding protein, partial [Gammaproteobacteria bacterium]|nr:[Fe-S]-binding protein [Gammaproteobacteria bacterium]